MTRKGQRLIPDEDRKKHQLAVRLTDQELNTLESIAKKKDLPISYFIRQGIGMVIEKYEK
jgi:bifunctional DNA-binding transcriptional regulator/antitoxin component of YhaV-PrlF toxin-antitoxin module